MNTDNFIELSAFLTGVPAAELPAKLTRRVADGTPKTIAEIKLGDETYKPHLVTTPQARTTRPYDGRPACEGNSNCIPYCPTHAKYE